MDKDNFLKLVENQHNLNSKVEYDLKQTHNFRPGAK